MIIRVVKMEFKLKDVQLFLNIFNESKNKIRDFKGCLKLDLIQDVNNPAIFFTISRWEDENALDNYRNSTLFNSTWRKTKIYFANKADAWSTELVASL